MIAIDGDYGSGCEFIGSKVAAALGILCYGEDIVGRIAAESNLAEVYVREHLDAVPNGWLGLAHSQDFRGNSLYDKLHAAQRKVIRELAAGESCVIVGHWAGFILRDSVDVLTVFVHSKFESRMNRMECLRRESAPDSARRLKRLDEQRRLFLQFQFGRKYGSVEDFHIALDSGALGAERCAEAIIRLA